MEDKKITPQELKAAWAKDLDRLAEQLAAAVGKGDRFILRPGQPQPCPADQTQGGEGAGGASELSRTAVVANHGSTGASAVGAWYACPPRRVADG